MSISRAEIQGAHRTPSIIAAPAAGGTTLVSGPLTLFNVCLTADGVNAAQIVLYDNTAASGDDITIRTPVSTSTQQEWEPNGVPFDNGLFVTRNPTQQGWTAVITYIAE